MKVLIPVENKTYGDAVVDFAMEHRWHPNTQFRVFHVVEPARHTLPNISIWGDIEAEVNEQRLNAGHMLVSSLVRRLQQALPEADIEEVVVLGIAKTEILNVIHLWAPELVILGAHAKPFPAIAGLGSISCAVLLTAPCSVVTVRLVPVDPELTHETELSTVGHEPHQKFDFRALT